MRIVIPMSGVGRRFQMAGYADPKPLINVGDKTMIEHVIGMFPGETAFDFICNEEHLAKTPMRTVLNTAMPTGRIWAVPDKGRKGPVDAVLRIADQIPDDEEVIVSYCDYGTVWDYKGFLEEMRQTGADGGIAAYIGFHPHMLGPDHYAYLRHEDHWVTGVQEKLPFPGCAKMDQYASNGTYYFRTGAILKQWFQRMVDVGVTLNGEYYVSLVYNFMIHAGLRVRVFPIQKMLQWGTPRDLQEYQMWQQYFRMRTVKPLGTHGGIVDEETTVLLPMAGAGSRFSMVGYKDPKPLLPVEGIPMFIRALQDIPGGGRTICVCQEDHVGRYPIRQLLQTWMPKAEIMTVDGVTEGQACTCEIAIREGAVPKDKPILISACDNGAYYDPAKYRALLTEGADVIVWAFTNHPTSHLYPHMYAWLDVDTNGRIHEVSIKKPFETKANTHCIIGTMWFRSAALFEEGLRDCYDINNRTNGEFYVDNVLQPLIAKGYNVRVFPVDYYLCWGTPNDYKTYMYWSEHFRTITS